MSTDRFRSAAVLLLGALAAAAALDRPLNLRGLADGFLSGSLACGTTYRVAAGDTLGKIAIKAYGRSDYRAIFDANRDTLSSPSRLAVGDELVIPCRDGVRPQTAPQGSAMASAGPAQRRAPRRPGHSRPDPVVSASVIVPDLRENSRIRLLTGSDFAPFADTDLPGNGMAAEMVQLAVARAAPGRKTDLTVVEDWSRHLDLLADGRFDLGFPWYKPDCTKTDMLSASMQRRCADFDFSAPIFEIAIGYYVRAGDPLASQPVAAADYRRLVGRRICRPATHFTFDLDQQGLRRPETALVFPPAAADCFRLLRSGAVDVVTLDRPLAEKSLMQLGLVGRVVEVPALASRQTLHVIAAKANPWGQAYLDLIDAGSADLRATGLWFEIAARYFGALGIRPQ